MLPENGADYQRHLRHWQESRKGCRFDATIKAALDSGKDSQCCLDCSQNLDEIFLRNLTRSRKNLALSMNLINLKNTSSIEVYTCV